LLADSHENDTEVRTVGERIPWSLHRSSAVERAPLARCPIRFLILDKEGFTQ
jgi:hypothetical protein